MNKVKSISIPLSSHYKISSGLCPSNDEEKKYMSRLPYVNAVEILMYLMVCTRPYISHAVGVVSRYMENPRIEHWAAVKWVLRYVRGTNNYCITFEGSNDEVCGYVYSNFASDLDKRRSTSVYVFTLAGGPISWMSKLQDVVTLSTTEAEYVSA